MEIDELKKRHGDICNEYVHKMELKNELEFEGWVGDTPGNVATFNGGEYFFMFEDIVYDINENIEPGIIKKWYNENVENLNFAISYWAYTKGARINELKKIEENEKNS